MYASSSFLWEQPIGKNGKPVAPAVRGNSKPGGVRQLGVATSAAFKWIGAQLTPPNTPGLAKGSAPTLGMVSKKLMASGLADSLAPPMSAFRRIRSPETGLAIFRNSGAQTSRLEGTQSHGARPLGSTACLVALPVFSPGFGILRVGNLNSVMRVFSWTGPQAYYDADLAETKTMIALLITCTSRPEPTRISWYPTGALSS